MESKTGDYVSEVEEVTNSKSIETEQQTGGDVLLVSEEGLRKIPIPTDDPNDPLNYGKWKKAGIVLTCCWFSIFSLLSLSGTGTFMQTLIQLYAPKTDAHHVSGLSTYPSMVMAFGCFLFLPLSFVLGRRPVFIFVVLLAMITVITAGSSHDFQGHFISKIFTGIATGATESILPLIITDVTFLSERSFYFGLYWSTQNCVNAALLISLSYLTAAAGWRWYYWLFAIALGASLMLVIFLCPETRFSRGLQAVSGQAVFTDEFGATHILSDAEARERFGTVQAQFGTSTQKKSYLEELNPWSGVTPEALKVLGGAFIKIGKSASSPAVIFSLLASSMSLGIAIGITIIYSTILEVEYHWSPASVGLFNAGTIPACFLAMLYAGWCADKINIWLAKRNGGIHKAEHHLIHMIAPGITGAIGITLIAVCAHAPQSYSAWTLVVGWAIYQFSFTAILITTTTLAAETVPESPGAALVVVVGGKNLVSFGLSYGIIPMIFSMGYLKALMTLLGIFLAIFSLGLPVYSINPKWRKVAIRNLI